MNLILLIETSSEVTLVLILFHKWRVRVYSLQVLDDAEFTTLIDFLVVFNEFVYDLFIGDLFLHLLAYSLLLHLVLHHSRLL